MAYLHKTSPLTFIASEPRTEQEGREREKINLWMTNNVSLNHFSQKYEIHHKLSYTSSFLIRIYDQLLHTLSNFMGPSVLV